MATGGWRVWVLLAAMLGPAVSLTGQERSGDLREGLETLRIQAGGFVFDALAAGPADGQRVLLLHGFPQTSLSYRHQIRALGAAGYRAVAFDQRGYSPGARPEGVAPYAVPNLVADVLAVADALEADRFHLVGHDWGAAVAWIAAATVPGRVRSLTVLSTPHPTAMAAQRADPESDQSRRSAYFARFSADGAERGFLEDDAAFLRGVYESLDPAAVESYLEVLGTPEALRAALAWYRAAFAPPASGQGTAPAPPPLPPVQPSTVYLFGTEDLAFSWASAEGSGDHVAGPYRLVALEGRGHWLPEEAPDRVNRALLAHLRETSGDPDGLEAQLGRLRADFSRALILGDGDAVAAAYAADGALLPPDREIRGADEIRRYFTSGRDAYRQVAHAMLPDQVRIRGDVVSEVGTWTSTIQREGRERTTTTDRYLLVWERGSDGAWRIAYDMWHR